MPEFFDSYQVAVIGAGHAGCEAALAAARLGAKTLLLTINMDTIALMPCSPSIGGPAKGHLVREIDALGGEMARATDDTYIHIRMLNTGRGPAVQALRAQTDKNRYSQRMRKALENQENLTIKQETVIDINVMHDGILSIDTLTGIKFRSETIIITTGTFLNGKVHLGDKSFSAGRMGEFASTHLSESLTKLGFEMGRLKTGTVPRVDSKSLDFTKFKIQNPNPEPLIFSFRSEKKFPGPQLPCWITHTNKKTHEIIKNNLHRSALYGGKIFGTGARYCPSIEDKMKKFPNQESHHVFIEPETMDFNEIYLQGLSTSLPEEIQYEYLRTIPGMENASIVRPGYAIEYDFVFPEQLKLSLESKSVNGIFFAGQINGTSGYEEAAGQGLIAGINSVMKIRKKEPLIIKRSEGYIGVMINDLTTIGTREPYRLFTSSAEFRLILRHDNADLRLTEFGYNVGLISELDCKKMKIREKEINNSIKIMNKSIFKPSNATKNYFKEKKIEEIDKESTFLHLLRRPEIRINDIIGILELNQNNFFNDISIENLETIEIMVKYEGYIKNALERIKNESENENMTISSDIEYSSIIGLSKEAIEKLQKNKPETVGQAARIPGIRVADISVLIYNLSRKRKTGEQ